MRVVDSSSGFGVIFLTYCASLATITTRTSIVKRGQLSHQLLLVAHLCFAVTELHANLRPKYILYIRRHEE